MKDIQTVRQRYIPRAQLALKTVNFDMYLNVW
jgi:hypothetical protein